jgi:hypothetical protein
VKIEDDHFWPAEKTRFWVYISITAFVAVAVAFVIYGWILYQRKVKEPEMDSNPRTASATAPLNTGDDSTDAAQPSTSPATNSN